MNLLQFKDTHHYTEFSSPRECMDLIKEMGLETTTIKLYENQKLEGPVYYTLFKTIYTLKKPGTGILITKIYEIEDRTFEELKERHYKAACKALDDIGKGQNMFIAIFGFNEPKPHHKDYYGTSGVTPQKVNYKGNSNRRYH